MMRRKYSPPYIEVIDTRTSQPLLTGSSGLNIDSNIGIDFGGGGSGTGGEIPTSRGLDLFEDMDPMLRQFLF